jgi:nucleoside-diphosphate-sugar epimerase
MSKSVLIIGSEGYIGSRIIHDLQNEYEMHGIDICWFGQSNTYTEVKDYNQLTKKELSKYYAVVLLAGHSSVKMCDGPVLSSWSNNVNNFIDLINKLDKGQVLIYASSGSVYGTTNTTSVEDAPLQFKPINNYDLTKYSLDVHAEKFIRDGYNIVGLRFGTVNGWSPNIREELMINSMTKKAIREGSISINNKTIKRPILGISDISRAIKQIIEKPIAGVYNLASFNDTVQSISDHISHSLNATIEETINMSGVYDFDMSTDKFKKTYNFTFEESIQSIIKELADKDNNYSNRNIYIKYE